MSPNFVVVSFKVLSDRLGTHNSDLLLQTVWDGMTQSESTP